MFNRQHLQRQLAGKFKTFPAVALLGLRQAGKSTLAGMYYAALPEKHRLAFFDLERPSHRDRLTRLPETDLETLQAKPGLLVIDEIQRLPELFTVLRPLLDAPSRKARYLLLGSASPTVVRGVSESLAGRIGFLDLPPLLLAEVAKEAGVDPALRRLWLRGGLPRAFLARSEASSREWRDAYLRAFIERDLAQLGLGSAQEAIRRLLTMLAHWQGGILKVSELAAGLSLSAPTVDKYIDILEGTFLVRRLPSFQANLRKRLTKAPKIYIRDSGVLHALLGIEDREDLLSHPKVGASFEGWVIEQILGSLRARGDDVEASYFRTHAGAEVDLILRMGTQIIPIEIKLSTTPAPGRGLIECMKDLESPVGFVVHAGRDAYPIGPKIRAVPVGWVADPDGLAKALSALPTEHPPMRRSTSVKTR